MSIGARSESGFRPDLEGLRGVAILLVIACHAAIPGAAAGFIGVDIFFVLSGFLITRLLVDEWERTGRIDVAGFYARRARRILPAAAVVLVATLVAAMVVLSPLDMTRIAADGLAAGLSVANLQFALSATDYFAPVDPSPMLHFWSLSVEEQFYLFWPALLIIAARHAAPRRRMVVIVAVVLLVSLAACLVLSMVAAPWAYFSLPTRAWQLAAGGALAMGIRGFSRITWPILALVGWAGLGLIAASMLTIGSTTTYPGMAAAAPTAGTLALIAAGAVPVSPGRLLLIRGPMRWLGRISYSLYLWHWPVLILGTAAFGAMASESTETAPSAALRLGLVGIAVILASLSWHLIEEPFRTGRLSHGGRRRALAIAVAALMSVTVASTGLSYVADRDVADATVGDVADPADAPDEALDWPSADPTVQADVVETGPVPSAPGSASAASPSPSATTSASPKPNAAPAQPARVSGGLPAGLRPSLGAARDDTDRLLRDGCALGIGGSDPPDCVYGDDHGSFTVALVGDSHAMNWFPALNRVANRNHWRLVPYTKFSCVFVDMRIWSDNLGREYTECETWRERVVSRLRRLKPDLTIISSNKWFPPIVARDGEPERQGKALAGFIERIPGRVAILVDTPRSDHDVPACLARHPRGIEACTTTKRAAVGWRHRRREVEARRITGAPLIDLTKAICPTDPCPPVIGKRMVYRDHHHLTATFAASLAADLDAAIAKVMAG
jgi:peptidoglycan/LPS O-acetylase OafA/YrhL